MSTAEYEGNMSEIAPADTQEQREAFAKLHSFAKKIHTAEIGDIEQFKSIMDKLMAIEADIKQIKKHFNIVHIVG